MPGSARKLNERRREAPDVRRRQLIEATLKCIAQRGISGTTLADVAREAGLSQGIVNLHFRTKENLLNETLTALADSYTETMNRALAAAGPLAADRLAAVIDVDFMEGIYNTDNIAVWYAFRGEAGSRPTYQRICQKRDHELDAVLIGIVEEMLRTHRGSISDPRSIVDGLSALTDGLWLDYLINPQDWSRQRARDVVYAFVASVFPAFGRTQRST